ncbi:hypothetical protein [Dentiradicibacter hellwigii]|uniref:Uncharacterized protein n=1 Tax=Dentiradicibacter hellwigii TaxID=3149053 RepID=A0ABV4UA60_9RHOO
MLRAREDFRFFTRVYFPHYVRSPAESELHKYLYKLLPEIVGQIKSAADAIAAPRGEAKSTLVSQLFVLWCLVTGRKRYPVIVMDSIDQAYPMLEAIKAELEFNPRLMMDFPDATGRGSIWNAGTIITRRQCQGAGVWARAKKCAVCATARIVPTICVLDDNRERRAGAQPRAARQVGELA